MFVGLDGRGQVSWILEDGTEAYVRARGLNVDELVAVADAPKPRPATAPIASFDLPDTAPASFGLIAEHTAPWTIKNASVAAAQPAASTCVSVSSQPQPPSGMGSGSIWGITPNFNNEAPTSFGRSHPMHRSPRQHSGSHEQSALKPTTRGDCQIRGVTGLA